MKRRTIVAIVPSNAGFRDDPAPVDLGSGIQLWQMKELHLTALDYSPLGDQERDRFANARLGLVVSYEGARRREMDSDASGITREDVAIRKVGRLLTCLQLVKANPIAFRVALHQEDSSFGYQMTGIDTFSQSTVPLPSYERTWVDLGDFEHAQQMFATVDALQRESPVWFAFRVLARSLAESDWLVRFTLLWIGLESLFGADIEISWRMSQRIALFLRGRGPDASAVFKILRKDYRLRSKTVHGSQPVGEPQDVLVAAPKTALLPNDGRDWV